MRCAAVRDRRRRRVLYSQKPDRALRGTSGGTGWRGRAPEERSPDCTRSTARDREKDLRRARRNADAGDAEDSAPIDHWRRLRQTLSWISRPCGFASGQENGEEADTGSQMFRITGNGEQSFGGGAKQDVIDRLFVVEGDPGDLFGNGENDVEIGDRQQFGLPAFQPFGSLRSLT